MKCLRVKPAYEYVVIINMHSWQEGIKIYMHMVPPSIIVKMQKETWAYFWENIFVPNQLWFISSINLQTKSNTMLNKEHFGIEGKWRNEGSKILLILYNTTSRLHVWDNKVEESADLNNLLSYFESDAYYSGVLRVSFNFCHNKKS